MPKRIVNGVGECSIGVDGSGSERRVRGSEIDQAIGIGDGKRTQKDRVHDAEDGGIRADSEGQGEDGCCRKAGALRARAQAEAEIAEQLVEACPSASQVVALSRGSYIAERDVRFAASFAGAQASAFEFVGFEFEMRFDLRREIVCTALAMENGYASSPCGPLLASRIMLIARVRRCHSPVFSASCARPLSVSV
jgi:hypothetical protein